MRHSFFDIWYSVIFGSGYLYMSYWIYFGVVYDRAVSYSHPRGLRGIDLGCFVK